jgi:hypothetical protein
VAGVRAHRHPARRRVRHPINKAWVPGSAAHGIAKRLSKLGATLVADPESFRVVGTPGPLAAGELDRARQWGEQLATTITVPGGPSSKR